MPRKAKEMTALEVKRIKHPGTGTTLAFAVGGVAGLRLQVTPNGSKAWVLPEDRHHRKC